MGVASSDPVSVLDDDQLAEPGGGGGEDDPPGGRSTDRRAFGRRDVDPCMEAISPWAEQIAERAGEGARQPERRSGHRRAESGIGRWACDAVRRKAGPDLELAERRVGVRTQHTVEGRRRKAVPRERKLKRGDVPATTADREIP